MAKNTVLTLKKKVDEGGKVTMVTSYDYTMAALVEEAGIDMILVGDSLGMTMMGYDSTIPVTMDDMVHHTRCVTRATSNTFVVGDMPFLSYEQDVATAVSNAGRLMKEGRCQAVKLEGGAKMADKIRAITDAGIPVLAHIGLTPQTASSLGGLRLQGASKETADRLVADAVAVTEAGAFAICLECMPSVVAKRITETISIPTLGIGAGPDVDCQELNLYDMLGLFKDFKPKFVKQFANVRKVMVDGLNKFHDETLSGEFPTPEFSFNKAVEIPAVYGPGKN